MPILNQGREYRSQLGPEAAGLSVLDFLTQRYARFTPEEWLERIEAGRVLLDGVAAPHSAILRPGQVLSWMRPPWEEPEVPRDFAILFQDGELLAVAKPRGLPVNPGGGDFQDHTLLALVRRRFPGANPLHRLGRGTSGIVLFARTPAASSSLLLDWRRGAVLKAYLALAAGSPAEDKFRVDTPIGPVPHPVLGTVHAASAVGKPASSHVEVLERRDSCSLLEVRITTGRPHQIRIHLASAGHPLLGDPLYGVGGLPAEGSRALPGDIGYWLHAARLGFSHPATGQWMEIACQPPPPLRSDSEPGRATLG